MFTDTEKNHIEYSAAFEFFAKNDVISADAAAFIANTIFGLESRYVDFKCQSPEEALTEEQFTERADELAKGRAKIDSTLQEMFDQVAGKDFSPYITPNQIKDSIAGTGIQITDKRLGELGEYLREAQVTEQLTPHEFIDLCSSNIFFIRKVLQQELVVPDFETFQLEMDSLYELVEPNRSGSKADYIPVLRDADPERWGVSVCTVDGQRYSRGDVHDFFSVQSTSKPITYAIALAEQGKTNVHSYVGFEPSGKPFNHPDMLPDNRPYNPMVNAGAIMTCSILASTHEDLSSLDLIEYVRKFWVRLSGGGALRLSEETMISEKSTADNNFALAYLMRGKRGLPTPLDKTLDFYFGLCSLEATCESMSIVAATLANGGVCPITGDAIFSADIVKSVLSVMSHCGMYDNAGEFFYNIGIPAKSGVSGIVIIVIPNVGGFATFSPRLDSFGNSIRGVELYQRLVANFPFHVFDNVSAGFNGFKTDPINHGTSHGGYNGSLVRWAADLGDTSMLHLRALFLKSLVGAASAKGKMDAARIEQVQTIYMQCMNSFVPKIEVETISMGLGNNALEFLCDELAESRVTLDNAALKLLFDGMLLLLVDDSTFTEESIRPLVLIARSLGIPEDNLEFLKVKWSKMKLGNLKKAGSLLNTDLMALKSVSAISDQESPVSTVIVEEDTKIKLIKDSWAYVMKNMSHAGKLQYSRLFWLDNSAAATFKNRGADMDSWGRVMIKKLDTVIQGLDDTSALVADLKKFGKHHLVDYRVKPEHYEAYGESIFWMLEQVLGAHKWTPEVSDAWKWFYDFVKKTMLEGTK